MRDEDDARDQGVSGGTGNKLSNTIITLAGVAALVASLLSFVFVSLDFLPQENPTDMCSIDQFGFNRKTMRSIYKDRRLCGIGRTIANPCYNDMSFEYS